MKDFNELSAKQEKIGEIASPIDLVIDDTNLIKFVTTRIDQSVKFYKDEKNLYERQKKNEDYLFGRQLDLKSLKPYQARYMDNVIYEAEATIKPIALSRLPDLYVTPGNNGDNPDPMLEAEAKKITNFINSEVRRREHRRVLGIAFKHVPVGFMGAIKYRWNPQKGKYGNYEFYVVHYSRLTLDHHAKTNDEKDMDFVRELVDMSIKEVLMKFPDAKDKLFTKLGLTEEDVTNETKMATRLTLSEVWFRWYNDTADGNHQTVSGVLWKYDNILLKKMKNPNWDWQGETITFKYDEESDVKEELSMEDLRSQALQSFVMGNPAVDGLQSEVMYHNYFDQPEFPYIFLGYDQFGTMPYDETSPIEQNIYKQDNINKRGRQITEMADRAKGRHIFSDISGLSSDEVEQLDLDDADVDIMVDGPVGESHEFIPGEQPSSALFQDQDINRNRVFQSMGTNSTTRGQKETDVATTAQILRESDFGRIDDLVEDTINYAAEKMARAILQLIKLRYTEQHFVNIMGQDGSMVYDRLHRDMIKDGMEVIVHASGVDKLMRKKEAYEKAGMKLIDPLTFFEATDEPNPKEKTERLITFMTGAQDGFASYMTKFVMDLPTTADQTQTLTGQTPDQIMAQPETESPQEDAGEQGEETPTTSPSQISTPQGSVPPGAQEALMAIAQLTQGQTPQPPAQITPGYLQVITAFIKSTQFKELDPKIQALIIQFAQTLTQHPQIQSATQGAGATPPETSLITPDATATTASPGIGGLMGNAMATQLKGSFIKAGL